MIHLHFSKYSHSNIILEIIKLI